jgi:hypothetical protein
MRNPILSRLLLGSALAAALTLGVLAMRAALPTSEAHATTPHPAAPRAAPNTMRIEVTTPAPVADATIGPVAPAEDPPPAEAAPAAKAKACAGDDVASGPESAPTGDAHETAASRPTVVVDADRASTSSTRARGSHRDRPVSSGPMRMLGGGESTW